MYIYLYIYMKSHIQCIYMKVALLKLETSATKDHKEYTLPFTLF